MSVYKNGNTIVEIRDDGTKIRYIPDNQPAQPVYPESIDMKICNMCMVNPPCPMCHEQSNPNGKFADLSNPILNSLHPFMEVAIGGGDPMLHPDIGSFLEYLKEKQVIANITVHWKSFMDNYGKLKKYENDGLIHGLGISINEVVPDEVIKKIQEFKNAVVHVVMGIVTQEVVESLYDKGLNILILGYKTFGRGVGYRINNSFSIDTNIKWLQRNIKELPEHFRAVSFDNLAIAQIDLKTTLKREVFNQMYMGNDGNFSMYIDLVENKYAVSSTSFRYNINKDSIDELFSDVRKRVSYG